MKKNEQGFGVVEGLLIVVTVGIIGFVGWYIWHSKKASNKTPSAAATTGATNQTTASAAVYKRTTTTPSSWLTYSSTDAPINFTIAYPPEGFTVSGVATPGVASDPVYSFGLVPTGHQFRTVAVDIYHQSLAATVALQTRAQKVTKSTQVTVDGHAATIVDTYEDSTNTVPTTDYFIYSNSYTFAYHFFGNYSSGSTSFNTQDALTMFESLKIH